MTPRKLRKTTALLTLLAVAFLPTCGVFKRNERLIFVREDLTINGAPRQILKTTEPVTADVAFTPDGSSWVVAHDTEIPAGWLLVSPAIIDEGEKDK